MIKNARIVTTQADPEEYHTITLERGDPAYPVSASMLRTFIVCPARWRAGYVSPDSTAKAWGSQLDDFLLSPERFAEKYVIRPATYPAPAKHAKVKSGEIEEGDPLPWNSNAGWCDEWLKAHEGMEVVKPDEMENLEAAAARLRSDDTISGFLDASEKQVWVAAEWHDPATGLVVPMKGMIDLVPRRDSEFPKVLGDLKTTRNAAVIPWQRWCHSAGYHVQAAMYLDLYCAATGEDRLNFCYIVQENFAPWQPAKRMMAEDFITLGRGEYEEAIKAYCAMLKRGKWADYDSTDEAVQGWTLVSPEPWMAMARQFGPKFIDPDEDTPAPEEEEPPFDVIP